LCHSGDPKREAAKKLKPRHQDCLSRLSRIEGQVRGVSRMIEEERYCIDILTQLRAIKAALGKVETEILKDHADHCVADAIKSGSEKKQREKFGELIELFERYQQ
jgi:DNA-binding FrmR family transcriptional regulator